MRFSECVKLIIDIEGGVVDDPRDLGGLTKYGISYRVYGDELGRTGIRRLTKKKASQIYRRDYWDKADCSKLPPCLRLLVFDFFVHSGVNAIKTLQRTVGTKPDGIVGPKTLGATRKMDKRYLTSLYMVNRLAYLRKLKTFKIYGSGWVRRLFIISMHNKI